MVYKGCDWREEVINDCGKKVFHEYRESRAKVADMPKSEMAECRAEMPSCVCERESGGESKGDGKDVVKCSEKKDLEFACSSWGYENANREEDVLCACKCDGDICHGEDMHHGEEKQETLW